MAGPTKRLRRKTTVSQSGCSELLMLTSEWWMQFVLPVGHYVQRNDVAAWIRNWRLLCKEWREVWDQGFRVKMSLHQDYVSMLCNAAQCYGDLLFVRDRSNKILYHQNGKVHEGLYCTVSMQWKTFKELRPILLRMAKLRKELRMDRGTAFSVLSFVQTGGRNEVAGGFRSEH